MPKDPLSGIDTSLIHFADKIKVPDIPDYATQFKKMETAVDAALKHSRIIDDLAAVTRMSDSINDSFRHAAELGAVFATRNNELLEASRRMAESMNAFITPLSIDNGIAEAIQRATLGVGGSIAAALDQFNTTGLKSISAQLAGFSLGTSVTDAMRSIDATLAAGAQAFTVPDFGAALAGFTVPDLSHLEPLLEQHRRAILDAPNEPARRRTVAVAMVAIEEATHFQLPATPESLTRFVIYWLVFILMLQHATYQSQQRERTLMKGVDRRFATMEREHAETVAVLAEARRQLYEKLAAEPMIILEVARRGVVRVGPSGATERITTVKTNQRVKWLQSFERWRYVELLDDAGHGTGVRGWIYRRSVRVIP
jgi:hypothetical protein